MERELLLRVLAVVLAWRMCGRGMSPGWVPWWASHVEGRCQWFALNFARRSSRESACRKVRMAVLDAVKGSLCGITPTEQTVSLRAHGAWVEKGESVWASVSTFDV